MLDAVPLASLATLSIDHDWFSSAVGAPATWPGTLRVTVDIMLNTPLPMLLCWGPQRAVLFNGAYAALAGAGHPAAPGGCVPALLPVPLAVAGDSVEQAFSGVAAHLRRCSLQFAGSALAHEADLHLTPLLQDNGAVGGVLCALAPPTASAAASAAADGSALRILVV